MEIPIAQQVKQKHVIKIYLIIISFYHNIEYLYKTEAHCES